MKVRMIKRRHDARTLHRWRFLADLRAEMMIEDWQWDDDDRPSDECLHGDGKAPEAGKYRSGSQGSRRMFSTKAKALAAMRHEMEQRAAAALLKVDREIAAAMQAGEAAGAA